ncbi:hypothetical protein D0809_03380 [Flavobacterium circumlabens]|uniref:DUF4304 domain-containing protein n=1 Tax=Flavobacterium circumlabens TaxID=2133765 RepID=A0A4Y7UJU0_9FLAO|nr:hypothetical protein [Flavobacterium circumlabens]TCN60930.1 hypothetical protein EV142_101509 [Flavobacterium circumlabens]TEB46049.1 hypothetical protein D0809_03380 [Flavobacterium circumlabens]
MAIDKTIKKKITEEWLLVFPQLSAFAQNKLYKIVGCCILGIELIKSPFKDNYSPYFVIYPLWKKDVKACLDYPIILKNFKNKKGFEFDIPYERHEVFFSDVIESVKKQTPLLFDRNISLKEILSVLDEYAKTPPLSAAPNSYLQALLQEIKFEIALITGVNEAHNILEEISKRAWDVNHFRVFGVEADQWLQELQKTISNREELLKRIEINKEDKKISKLKSSEIIL